MVRRTWRAYRNEWEGLAYLVELLLMLDDVEVDCLMLNHQPVALGAFGLITAGDKIEWIED